MSPPYDSRQNALVFLAISALVLTIVLAGVGAIIYSRLSIDDVPPEGIAAVEESSAPLPPKIDKPPPPEEGYVGSQKCTTCHAAIAERYQTHPMAHSLAQVLTATEIENYEQAEFSPPGDRTYRVERRDGKVFHHEVMLDVDQQPIYDQAEEVKFAMGSGRRGRSYLIFEDGLFFQSPIGWYSKDNKWDLSPGYMPEGHARFSRRITEGCFYCHAGRTNLETGTSDHYTRAPFLEAAIGCERCHGPGEKHIAYREQSVPPDMPDPIVNPAKLSHAQSESVCYQCHLQGEHTLPRYGRQHRDFRPGQLIEDNWIIFVQGQRVDEAGQTKAVSQVEQMRASRCYIESSGSMGCTSCHDPHWSPPPDQRLGFYQDRCNSCHADKGCAVPEPERLASNASGSCIVCHMPPLDTHDVPHTALTDHRILRRPAPAAEPSPSSIADAAKPKEPLEFAEIFDNADQRLPQREVDRAKGLAIVHRPEVYSNPRLLNTAQHLLAPIDPKVAEQNQLAFLDVIGDDVDALVGMGLAFQIQRDYERADACWQQILRIAPNDEDALWWMLVNNHQRGRLPEAATYAQRLLQRNPRDPNLYGRQAHILGQLGNLPLAVESAENALRYDPTLTQVREWLVEAYEQLRQPEKALSQLKLLQRVRARENAE